MPTEHPLNSVTEKQVKAVMADSMANQGPRLSARQILETDKKRRHNKRISRSIIAAVACLLLMLASFNLPMVAQAVSAVPILGDAYLNFIKGSGLDIAYQAGFVSELGYQQERYGITLTVLGAYADNTETSVMFTLSADKDLMQQVWDGSYAPWADPNRRDSTTDLRPWLKGAGSGGSTMQFDEAEGIIYGVVSIDSKKSLIDFGRKEILQIEAGIYGQPVWEVRFPVQTVSAKHIEKVKVDQTITHDGLNITLEEIIFSPSQTVLTYSTSGSVSGSKMPNWTVMTSEGNELIKLGGNYSTGGLGLSNKGKGLSRFAPTDDRGLSIYFRGQNESLTLELELPLDEGERGNTGQGDFTVEKIISEEKSTQVVLSWTGNYVVRKVGAVLQCPSQKTEVKIEGLSNEEGQVSLVFPAIDTTANWILAIDHLYLEELTLVKVFEIR